MSAVVQDVKIKVVLRAILSATEAAAIAETEIKVQNGDGPKMDNGTQELDQGANENFLSSNPSYLHSMLRVSQLWTSQIKGPRKGKFTLTPTTYVGAPLHAVGQPRHGLCPQGSRCILCNFIFCLEALAPPSVVPRSQPGPFQFKSSKIGESAICSV